MAKVSRDQGKQAAHRKANYTRFEIYIKRGTLLEALLLRYKQRNPIERTYLPVSEQNGGLSELVRNCLCERFNIEDWMPFVAARLDSQGIQLPPTHDLDMIINDSRAF